MLSSSWSLLSIQTKTKNIFVRSHLLVAADETILKLLKPLKDFQYRSIDFHYILFHFFTQSTKRVFLLIYSGVKLDFLTYLPVTQSWSQMLLQKEQCVSPSNYFTSPSCLLFQWLLNVKKSQPSTGGMFHISSCWWKICSGPARLAILRVNWNLV